LIDVRRANFMATNRYPPFFLMMHRFTATRSAAWLASRIIPALDRLMLKISGRRHTMTGLLAGLPVVVVYTVGARSRKPRIVPLLYIEDKTNPGTFALIASNWGQRNNPAWYYNLRANPRVRCSIMGRAGAYAAHEANGQEYERFWGYASETYSGYPHYRGRVAQRHIPIMVMSPLKS